MRYLFFAFCAMLLLSACRKNSKQIQRTWVVERVRIGGADKTADYTKNNYTETYADNGVYSFSGDPDGKSGTGKYEWDGKNSLKRHGVTNQESMNLTINTLTSDEFEYRTTLSGLEAEFKFRLE